MVGLLCYDAAWHWYLWPFIMTPISSSILPVNSNLVMKNLKIIKKHTSGLRRVVSQAPTVSLPSVPVFNLMVRYCLVAAHVILIAPFVFIGCHVVVVRAELLVIAVVFVGGNEASW